MGGVGSLFDGRSGKVKACTSSSGEFDYQAYLFKDTNSYTINLESKEEECSGVLRHPKARDKLMANGVETPGGDNIDTLWKVWQYAIKNNADQNCLGYRKLNADGTYEQYAYDTYKQVNETVVGLAKGLKSLGINADDNVGIFSSNRPEWTTSMISIVSRSARTIALYDTLGLDALKHIIGQAKIEVLFSEVNKLPVLHDLVTKVDNCALKTVIVYNHQEKYGNAADVVSEEMLAKFKERNVNIINLTDLIESAKDVPQEEAHIEPGPASLAIIMYTSGTTGVPKGVMLSHNAICTDLACACEEAMDDFLVAGDTHFSYLPLAHIFEMLMEWGSFYIGMNVCFFTGSMKRLAVDIQAAQPHIFCGVPRVYNKFYAKFHAKVSGGSWFSRTVAGKAIVASETAIRDGRRVPMYDKLVWSKAAGSMGLNRVKICITGAAPMPGYLAEFMRIVTNAPMVQGYGLTETAAASTITSPGDLSVGHVGYPLRCCEIRLRNVAEMNYLHTDEGEVDGKKVPMPRGEIEIRGAHLFNGYYEMPEKTKEVLSDDGWFSTGDIGRINPNGTVSIIDRKKNIFKMSQGEYIATEKIEGVYTRASSVGQIWVYGNSFKSFIVAVVVPDAEWTVGVLKNAKKWDYTGEPKLGTAEFASEFTKMVGDNMEIVYEAVKKDMANNTADLKGFEKIRDIFIEHNIDDILQGFSPENGLLTPSMKLKRPALINRYVKEVQELYTKNGEAPAAGEKWGNK